MSKPSNKPETVVSTPELKPNPSSGGTYIVQPDGSLLRLPEGTDYQLTPAQTEAPQE